MNFVYKTTVVLRAIFLFALLAAASASPWGAPSATTTSAAPAQTCSTGSVQCCQSLLPANSSAVSQLLGLLGIIIDDITALVGITCSPINIVGITGTQW